MSFKSRSPLFLLFLLLILFFSSPFSHAHQQANSLASLFHPHAKQNHTAMSSDLQKLKDLKAPYPEPGPDQRRYVIFLEPKEYNVELNDLKVELMPGRIEKVDGVNIHTVGGKIEEKTIEGWGYTYYEVTMTDGVASTRKGAWGPAAELKPRLVRMYVDKLYRYNSKLPIVVYMPRNSELRYRIWSATGAKEGIPAPEV